jgi:hypothetical protein
MDYIKNSILFKNFIVIILLGCRVVIFQDIYVEIPFSYFLPINRYSISTVRLWKFKGQYLGHINTVQNFLLIVLLHANLRTNF